MREQAVPSFPPTQFVHVVIFCIRAKVKKEAHFKLCNMLHW